MNQKTLLIIGGVVLAACCICAAVVGITGAATGILAAIGLTQPAVNVADNFMGALRDGDYGKAYGMCTRDLQQELGNVQGLKNMIEQNDVKPTKWSYTNREISGDRADLEGDVTFTRDREGDLSLVLFKEDDDWKVAGFNFKER